MNCCINCKQFTFHTLYFNYTVISLLLSFVTEFLCLKFRSFNALSIDTLPNVDIFTVSEAKSTFK